MTGLERVPPNDGRRVPTSSRTPVPISANTRLNLDLDPMVLFDPNSHVTDPFRVAHQVIPRAPISSNPDFTLRIPSRTDMQTFLQQLGQLNSQETTINGYETNLVYNTYMTRFSAPIAAVPPGNRRTIQPTGIHIPQGATIPNDILQRYPNLVTRLQNGTLQLQNIPEADRNRIIEAIAKDLSNDVMPLPQGRTRDFMASFTPDGRVFPYTLCPEHSFSRMGVPIVIPTGSAGNVTQSVDPTSLQTIFYRATPGGPITMGNYFQLTETAGPRGNGGTNGVVAPANQPLVVINGNQAYFVNPRAQ